VSSLGKHVAIRGLLASAIASLGCVSMLCLTAFAAGSGYGPTAPPPSAVAGGFTSIVTTQTVTSAGGTVTGAAFGATVTVTVPAGSLPNGGQVVLSAGSPGSIDAGSGSTVVADISVVFLDPNTGSKLPGPFSPPITVTISDPSIKAGDSMVIVTAPGQTTTVPGAQVTAGQALVAFTTDPNFAVVQSSTTSVSGATVAPTGEPFLGEGLIAGALVAAGAAGLVLANRRQRNSRLPT
jgi:hypothetical protein